MRGFIRATFLALSTMLAVAGSASAGIPAIPSQWYGLPGLNAASGADWVRSIAYTTSLTTVYAGTEGDGVYKSVNGGISWSPFNAGFPNPKTTNVRALMTGALPTSDTWAGTDSGLWKSVGGGAWQPIAQGPEEDPANPTKLNESVQAIIGLTGGPMLAGVFSGGVYRSTDGGNTWKPPAVNNGMPASETIWSLTTPLPNPLAVYATGSDGVFLSLDGGSTWTRTSDGIPDSATPMTTWAFSPTKPNILYAGTASNGIYRSVTAGLTWSPINDGLGAVRARGLQIFQSANGAQLYAGTENGLWEASQTASQIGGNWLPNDPKWHHVTAPGLGNNTIMWALTTPSLPGSGGAFGLVAGTQSNGGYFLQFQPVSSPCASASNSNPDCPHLNNLAPAAGDTLSVPANQKGTWNGTPDIDLDYQWQVCTTTSVGSCTDIDDATQTSYVIPDNGKDKYYRAVITATNPAPNFVPVKRATVLTGKTASLPGTAPGANQIYGVNLSVVSGSLAVGNTLKATPGQSNPNPQFSDGIFNPASKLLAGGYNWAYSWWRCDAAGSNCEPIPGATASTYKLTTDDGTHKIKVRVVGTNDDGSGITEETTLFTVTSAPAAIAAAIKDPDHPGQFLSQAPKVAGDAYVGSTLVGSVGGWKDPTTVFDRRWLRCDPDGTDCTTIYKPKTVQVANDPTYQIQPDDKGYVIRLRVTADVNGDTNHTYLPAAVDYDTAPTAVVTDPPLPPAPPAGGGNPGGGAPGGNPGGGSPQVDTVAPAIGGLTATKTTFVAGKGTVFRLSSNEAGKVRVVITKATSGRKVKGACVAQTKKNRKAKKCTFQKVVTSFEQPAGAGAVQVAFSGMVGKKKLPVGTYTATLVVIDGSGNASSPLPIRFTIKRK